MAVNLFQYEKDLTEFLTFKIPAKTKIFAEYKSLKELEAIWKSEEFRNNQLYHIGGGSNLLFCDRFDGLVLHSSIKGITSYSKNEDEHYIIAGAGEKWTDLVDWCEEHDFTGMECMAGIPGEVGASPVQNVGAFGAEAKDVIFSVECFDVNSGETIRFTNEECGFGYRTSRFKEDWKNRYFILRVSFKLRKSKFAFNYKYDSIKRFVESLDHQPTIKEVKTEVLRLRKEKLPDPAVLGSAGSFFKNPVIHKNYYNDEVLRRCKEVPSYQVDYRRVKVPAGWLIEHAGLKGISVRKAKVYPGNCLVIVNEGGATAEDVRKLSAEIVRRVNETFGILLHPEVNFIDTAIEVEVLGTGTSKGIPEIGCDCEVCRSQDKHDKRLRSSILVKTMGLNLLIDASPDFRYQAIRHNIRHVDALLLTHVHYDHVGGIDDLRPYCLNGDIPIYCQEDVDTDLRKRIDYCFKNDKYPGVPTFDSHLISSNPFMVKGVKIIPVKVSHGKLPILGFRIGKFAYVTDCKTIEESEKEKLKGLEVLIINSLRQRDHFAHLTIEEAVKLIRELKPKRAYLTHFCHEAGLHQVISQSLPEDIEPAYDGMIIKIK